MGPLDSMVQDPNGFWALMTLNAPVAVPLVLILGFLAILAWRMVPWLRDLTTEQRKMTAAAEGTNTKLSLIHIDLSKMDERVAKLEDGHHKQETRLAIIELQQGLSSQSGTHLQVG